MARKIGLGKYFCGISVSLVALLGGAWLMLAPFALGFQAEGEWIKATKIDFWTGLGVVVISLLGLLLFIASLRRDLNAAGIIHREPAPAAPVETATAPLALEQPEFATKMSSKGDEFDRTVAALATALAADLAERRKMTGEQASAHLANNGGKA